MMLSSLHFILSLLGKLKSVRLMGMCQTHKVSVIKGTLQWEKKLVAKRKNPMFPVASKAC